MKDFELERKEYCDNLEGDILLKSMIFSAYMSNPEELRILFKPENERELRYDKAVVGFVHDYTDTEFRSKTGNLKPVSTDDNLVLQTIARLVTIFRDGGSFDPVIEEFKDMKKKARFTFFGLTINSDTAADELASIIGLDYDKQEDVELLFNSMKKFQELQAETQVKTTEKSYADFTDEKLDDIEVYYNEFHKLYEKYKEDTLDIDVEKLK